MNKFWSHAANWLAICLLLVVFPSAAEEESITTDANGDYIITYRPYGGELVRVKWVPSTKVDPSIKWNVKTAASRPDAIEYRFSFKNGKSSRQHLRGVRLIATSVIAGSQVIPPGWVGRMTPDTGRSSGTIVAWSPREDDGGIVPGASQNGFAFESSDLPGIGQIKFVGPASGPSFPDHGPSELSPIYEQLGKLEDNNFVPRYAAIPKISVGTSYDGASVLDAVRTHVTKNIVDLKLIEPALASELDRLLQAAAEAIRHNSVKAARGHLSDAFKLIQRAHPDLDKDDEGYDEENGKAKGKSDRVDRLAARVIAFDIKYVEKRLKD